LYRLLSFTSVAVVSVVAGATPDISASADPQARVSPPVSLAQQTQFYSLTLPGTGTVAT